MQFMAIERFIFVKLPKVFVHQWLLIFPDPALATLIRIKFVTEQRKICCRDVFGQLAGLFTL